MCVWQFRQELLGRQGSLSLQDALTCHGVRILRGELGFAVAGTVSICFPVRSSTSPAIELLLALIAIQAHFSSVALGKRRFTPHLIPNPAVVSSRPFPG